MHIGMSKPGLNWVTSLLLWSNRNKTNSIRSLRGGTSEACYVNIPLMGVIVSGANNYRGNLRLPKISFACGS
jgi:hypothetical protein